ncbi:MAG: hypothetical protein JSV97_09420, partial [candidate division WOR-3 bacterium]
MRRLVLVLLFISFRFLLSNEIYSIPVQDIVYRIEKFHRFDRIVMPKAHSPIASGAPELPAVTSTYLLPRGQRLKDIKILSAEWRDLPGYYYIYPKQNELRIGDNYQFTEPDARIYGSSNLYPYEIIISAHTGTMRGYHVAQVSIIPFRYQPREGKLSLLKELKIEIETEPCEPGVFPRRETRLVKNAFEKFLSSIVINKDALYDALRKPPSYIEENPEDLAPTDLPSLLGPPVDFLIVTTDEQVDGYKDFARFKKLLGYNTAIKTMSWVRQHYIGVDDAERLRKFIKDAMEKWGVAYVLMGGDVPEIPTRWIWMEPIYNQWPVHAVTDLYFSDLDGNWNFDGDERFGETSDLLDLYPDVFVGRLPTTSSDEVRQYLGKVYSYICPTTTNTQIKALFFSSDFVVPDDAYQMALRLSDHLPPWFVKHFLNEKPLQDLKDSLYAGYNIVTGLGHGDVNIMRVKTNPTEYATNFFFDSLTNADHALMIVSTCYTNPFQSDCLSKHWILNPSGGGIGYIGPTMPCETYLHENYLMYLFDSLFYFPLSEANALSKIPYIPDSHWDNWYRLYQFSLSLLGDPALVLWDSMPTQYTAITITPDTIQVGIDTIVISVEPDVSSAVILYKEGETYRRVMAHNGVVSCEVRTESSGYLKYAVCDTVLAGRYIPHIDSVMVEPRVSYCVYEDCVIVDSLGNGNGVINPGEDICIYCEVRNVGGALASGVLGRLLCADSLLTVVIDTTSFVDIGPGEVSRCLTPFYIQVSDVMPDEHDFNFSLVLNYSGSVSEDSFQVVGSAPVLAHFGQDIEVIGDTLGFVLSVVNYGHAIADSVLGVISALSDTVLVLDSVVVLPHVGVNGVASSEPDSFWVYLTDSGLVHLNLRLYDQGYEVVSREFWVDEPGPVAMIWSRGAEASVVLGWSQVFGAYGYRVYRSVNRSGPYMLLNNHLVGVCLYEDDGVQAGFDYYYYVVVVDSSMNCSVSSDTVIGRMNPGYALGWPTVVYDYLFASPNFGDLDLF